MAQASVTMPLYEWIAEHRICYVEYVVSRLRAWLGKAAVRVGQVARHAATA